MSILQGVIRFLRRIVGKFSKWEKMIIVFCLLTAGGAVYFKIQNQGAEYIYLPSRGGIYTEGVLAENSGILDKKIKTLTYSGLLRLDENLNLKPALAKSWSIDENNQTYTFELFDLVPADKVKNTLTEQKDNLAGLDVQSEGQKIIIKTPKKIGSLIYNLTEPMFDFGPYRQVKVEDTKLILEANPDWSLGEPYISRIIIRIFQDEDKMISALESGDIQGADGVLVASDKQNGYTVKLQKYITLFFNLSRANVQNKGFREAVKNKTNYSPASSVDIVVLDQPIFTQEAKKLQTSLADKGATLSPKYFSSDQIKNEYIPNRNYDILLYGLDFGRDPDIYPYFYSGQIPSPGNNLSQYFNLEADKILDRAHQAVLPDKRLEATKQAQAMVDKDVPYILLRQTEHNLTISKEVKNIIIGQGITESDRFQNVWEWYIKEIKVKK